MRRGCLLALVLLLAGMAWVGVRARLSQTPTQSTDTALNAPAARQAAADPASIHQFRAWVGKRIVASPDRTPYVMPQPTYPRPLVMRVGFGSGAQKGQEPGSASQLGGGARCPAPDPGKILAVDDVMGGIALARERRAALKELIQRDPEAALQSALTDAERAALPKEIAPFIEQVIHATADVSVIATLGGDGPPVRRITRIAGRTYNLHAPPDSFERSTKSATLDGIAIDNVLAVRAQPFKAGPARRAPSNPGWKPQAPPARAKVVPPKIVGVPPAIAPPAPAAPAPAPILIAGDSGGTSPAGSAPEGALPGGTTGAKTLLVIRTKFTGQDESLLPTLADCQTMVTGASAFYMENSYGQTSLSGTINSTLVVLPHDAQWYIDNDTSGIAQNVLDDARAQALAQLALNYTQYELDAVVYIGGPGNFGGQANIGARGAWIKQATAGVASHELGHNLGNYHANYWQANPSDNPIGPGANSEYLDLFDTMGFNSGPVLHFNAFEKWDLGWLGGGSVKQVTTAGTYRLYAHDVGINPPGYGALTLAKDSQRTYWLEFRQNPGWSNQPWIWNGVGLRWGRWAQSNGGSDLIDTTPNSPDGTADSPITLGTTFGDPQTGVWITPIAKNGTAPVESVDVVINFGNPANNRAPTLNLTPSATTVSTGASVNITAAASDPDGDTLAYCWDFGDRTFGPNAAIITKSWSADGDYRVRCTVSDMKGKSTSKSVLIHVGAPTGFTITGQALDAAANPIAGVRIYNGVAFTNSRYRYALTDSDGTYALTNVAAGSYTMAASAPGYSLIPSGFANPTTVGPDQSNINFVATQTTYAIRGTVIDGAGAAIPGVIISDGFRSDITGPGGVFNLYGVPNGKFTLTASRTGLTFVTNGWSNPVNVNGADVINRDFAYIAFPWTISGHINGAPNGTLVTISAAGVSTSITIDNATDNAYTLANVTPGTWHLRATAAGKSFSPTGWSSPLTVNTTLTNKDFTADAVTTYAITGKVTHLGAGLSNVTLSAGAGHPSALTDTGGYYAIVGLANGSYTITPSSAGYTFTPTSQSVALSGADAPNRNFSTTNVDPPPTIVIAASANPNPVTALTTSLTVLADDNNGEDRLWYSWSALGSPPAPVTFSNNSAHAAKNSTATFTKAGSYTLRATVYDERGGSAASDVIVNVLQTASTVVVAPDSPQIPAGTTKSFSASLNDQFGNPMASQPSFAWSVTGGIGGNISSAGLFTSDGTIGAFTVNAACTPPAGGTMVGNTTITVFGVTATIVATDPQATEPALAGAPVPGAGDDEDLDPAAPAAGAPLPTGPVDTATFTITLSRTVAIDTVVHYAISGTATNGVDYDSLPGSVLIPAGQTSATITVNPIADGLVEVPETVILTIIAAAGYSPGAPASATAIIGDVTPASPTLSATALDGRTILIAWTDPFSNEEGYIIERLAPGGAWTPLPIQPANTTTFTDTGLTPDTLYTYCVRARNVSQVSADSNQAAATTWKPGDVDGDGHVTFNDYQLFERNMGRQNATWQQGDLNGDGVVNNVDFKILYNNFGH